MDTHEYSVRAQINGGMVLQLSPVTAGTAQEAMDIVTETYRGGITIHDKTEDTASWVSPIAVSSFLIERVSRIARL